MDPETVLYGRSYPPTTKPAQRILALNEREETVHFSAFDKPHNLPIFDRVIMLLLADVATGNRVLPDYQYLIVDEAHHIENASTDALSFDLSQNEIDWVTRELGGPSASLLGWLLTATQEILAPADYASLNLMVQRTTDLAFRFENDIRLVFQGLVTFLDEQREGRPLGMYSQQERILPSTPHTTLLGEVELTWDDTMRSLKPLIELIGKLIQGIADISEFLKEEDNELAGSLSNVFRKFSEIQDNLDSLVFNPKPEQVYWAEIQPNGNRLSLHSAPIHIGSLMEKFLWREKSSVILTSATLTTAGEFDYIRGRLNAQDAYELSLGSPFDYETASLLYLVNDIPEPGDRQGHQRGVEQGSNSIMQGDRRKNVGFVYFLRSTQTDFASNRSDINEKRHYYL